MARRLQALVMLMIVGFALPVSGAPQRFCTAYLTWLLPGQACHGCASDEAPDCDCDGGPASSGDAGCVAVAKVLPDAVHPDALAVPALVATVAPSVELPPAPETATTAPAGSFPPDRGPPTGLPLYLLKRSLLL